jgi:hypothetical protein
MTVPSRVLLVAIGMALVFASTTSFAEGGKKAYSNPGGEPAEDTYQTPYASEGDGRVLVYCAEDEVLVITPVDTGAAEAVCQTAE